MHDNTFEQLRSTELGTVMGGMKWQDFRPSTSIEDRRSPAAKRTGGGVLDNQVGRDGIVLDDVIERLHRANGSPEPLPGKLPRGLGL